MAELPDLTVFARILTRRFAGKKLIKLEITESRKLNVPAETLRKALQGSDLIKVEREGKTLHFCFSDGQILGFHLMLRGELIDLEKGVIPRFQIIGFHFESGEGFAVIDMQKQATPTLQPPSVKVPDALSLEGSYFKALLAKKKTLIKTLLMDQKAMRGIGNSYADEILYHAGISPFSTASLIPEKKVNQLYESIRVVLTKAIDDIEEANGDELKGELRDFMTVHSPDLKKTAKGEEIKTEKMGGRTSYYTESQELYN